MRGAQQRLAPRQAARALPEQALLERSATPVAKEKLPETAELRAHKFPVTSLEWSECSLDIR
jgi:hypothetical protein